MKASIAERLSHYGAWAPMVLFSWVNIHNVYLPAGLEFINTYLGFSVVMLAVVAACLFGLLPRVGRTIACTLDWAACAGMAVGCVLVVAPCLFGVGPHLALAGSYTAGLGIGWSYVRWALCLTHFGLRDLIRIVFVGCIVWTAARTGLNVLPLPASTAVAATVPLLSGIMLRLVLRCTDAAPRGRRPRSRRTPLPAPRRVQHVAPLGHHRHAKPQ